jgi:hypothetical protein
MQQGLESTFGSFAERYAQSTPASPAGARALELPPAALDGLATVLAAHSLAALLDHGTPGFTALREAVCRLVTEARGADPVRAERLIVTLCAWWRARPEVRRQGDEAAVEALWSELLHLCVAEFYSGRRHS